MRVMSASLYNYRSNPVLDNLPRRCGKHASKIAVFNVEGASFLHSFTGTARSVSPLSRSPDIARFNQIYRAGVRYVALALVVYALVGFFNLLKSYSQLVQAFCLLRVSTQVVLPREVTLVL